MNLNIINSVIKLVDKMFPDGTEKLKIGLALEQIKAGLQAQLTLSILSILVFLVYAGKTIAYRILNKVYFNTVEFWIDVVLLSAVFSFQFGIPFKDFINAIMAPIREFIIKKRK